MNNEKYIRYGLFSSIIIAVGPIFWLGINIYDKNYGSIGLNVVLVIISVTFVLFNFRNYLRIQNKKRNILVDFLFYVGLFVFLAAGFLVFYIGILMLQEKLFVKGEYLTYLIKSPFSYLIFVIMFIVAGRIQMLNLRKGKIDKSIDNYSEWKKLDKFIILAIGVSVYLIVTSTVVVTKDGIYDYSFFNLKGNKYSFSDVEYVDTGFVTKGRNKGEFFYNIKLQNGKKLKLAYPSMPQPAEKYYSDSWQEYVDIDKYIMNSGAQKSSSEEGSNYVHMDQIYIDKLLKVVRNK
ncbi:MAG: hypothetical protein ACRC68_06370 [Clostridium sp.]